MSNNIPYKKRRQIKSLRLPIVSEGIKEGLSYSEIADRVGNYLGTKPPSKSTIHTDVQTLLKEWQESNRDNMDQAVQLELARIDSTIKILWESWKKSTEDRKIISRREKGISLPNGKQIVNEFGDLTIERAIKTVAAERFEKQEFNHGDVRYITEIRHQLIERRKLLGLYSPDKQSIDVSRSEIDVSVLSVEQLRVLAEINRILHP